MVNDVSEGEAALTSGYQNILIKDETGKEYNKQC